MTDAARSDAVDLAQAAAHLLAVDPARLGGAVLRGGSLGAGEGWRATLRTLMPPASPWRRMPPGITEDRLLGGLDLGATLAAGRPIVERGLLAQVSGGVLLVSGAERLLPGTAAAIAAALDGGEVAIAREGITERMPTRFAVVLMDDGVGDERVPPSLADRVAFHLDLAEARPGRQALSPRELSQARDRLPHVSIGGTAIEALCAAGLAFGVPSLRAVLFARHAALGAAALAGRSTVIDADVELAAALVLAPRATRLPDQREPEEAASEPDEQRRERAESQDGRTGERESDDSPAPPNDVTPNAAGPDDDAAGSGDLTEIAVEATRAALPAHLLAELTSGTARVRHASPRGRAGAAQAGNMRGRPAGARRGMPGGGVRLALVETLRAAAPWQGLRRRAHPMATARVLVRRDDFRVAKFKARSESLTVFAVDASGSSALHRLAEAKGAVELILAECYVRRDQVALIAFRHAVATVVLPPTHSLARAKRALAGQVGGGGTPLAAALDASASVAAAARRKGQTPLVVLMTDGKANIDRAGRPGRAAAEADALAAARILRQDAVASLLVDIAPRSAEAARRLASAMGARYLALPHADARSLSHAVLAARPNE